MFRSLMMKMVWMLLASTLVATVGLASAAQARTYVVDPNSYAAIAYSPKTGEISYAYGYYSRGAAEREALRRCDADDARIVCWVNAGFCALAVGDDSECWGIGYSYGNGGSTGEAKDNALTECRARTTGARVVVLLLSDGQLIHDVRP